MGALHALLARRVPLEAQPADPDARAAWPWWKVKKWALNIACRVFNRYGDPKLCSGRAADAAFAARWSAECCQPFLEAVMQQLAAAAAQGAPPGGGGAGGSASRVAPRVANLLLGYVTEAVEHKATWRMLKPHAQELTTR
jgi:hypothetical protein